MPKYALLISLFTAILPLHQAAAAEAIGFRETTLQDPGGARSLHVSLWYPTTSDQLPVQLGETPAFIGTPVVKDASPETTPHPLVLLSHGYGGSWRNLAWLAGALAAKGYLVAAPDHIGTTTFDMRPPERVELWKRPGDLSRTIDALLADSSLAGPIEGNRIAAIGHSLGGWTVMALAGARFDTTAVAKNCLADFGALYCKIFHALGVGRDAASVAALEADLKDPRIGAVVSLDLGPGRVLTPKSLAAIQIPTMVLAAAEDVDKATAEKADIAATNKDSAYIATYLPAKTTVYAAIPGTLHFSFMQTCKPGAAELIEEEAPGESIVCRDAEGGDRGTIHQDIADRVLTFLDRSIPAK